MFRGVNTVNLDSKGRMALPTRYRGVLAECCDSHLVVTVHEDGCLMLYPLPEWEEVEHKLIRLPNQNRQARRLQRMLLGHATELDMDGHGRILLPQRLRDFAKLEKRVVLSGLGKKFEIWNEEAWDRSCEEWRSEEQPEGEIPEALDALTL
ncbi:division/cell wall cluster transcriptional repressor MraZ [Thiohalobacter sp. IOR34]|uniref:division/cell wall cluster transcriptional repressor MraZ n=1 Tax=Thiohalobacter sp. IOR34 TaxID=3057176 RepID=UPI0025AF9799|nr:division/cell wall cluster transcriptional repressor MraZ [Thiohalobacter sp. IOR34]WJW75016.1 division/cell wall cluster transcriptional repressor MraZ [Thiohalobacter sp. IOR34]